MNTSDKTYKALVSPFFDEVFQIIEKTCKSHNVPVYLIGAHARIFLFLEKGIKPGRGTGDIDFAVMMPDMASYDSFLKALIKDGFRKVKEPYRLIYDETDTVVDILPYGQIEEEGTVKFTDRKTELSVIGLEEVLSESVEIKHGGNSINMPPLIGILILKLISWSEKNDRKKDLDDICEIIKNYFEYSSEIFYKKYLDIIDELNDKNFILEAGSYMIGADIKNITATNESLNKLIQELIDNELQESPGSISIYFLQKDYFEDHKLVKRVFKLINRGLTSQKSS